MMIDAHNSNNDPIRKIIDPKSGFSLYMKDFKDSSICQVSTEITFPIPQDVAIDGIHSLNDTNSTLKSDLNTLKENQKELNKQTNQTISSIMKSNQQLTYLVYALIGLCIFNILF